MRYKDRIQFNASPLETSNKVGKPYTKEYHKFISSTIMSLNKGYSVTIFTEEQLKDLSDYFGDALQVWTHPTYFILQLKESEVKR